MSHHDEFNSKEDWPAIKTQIHVNKSTYEVEEIKRLRTLIAAIAVLKPGIIIPDHVMALVEWRKVTICRSENDRGYFIQYEA